MGPPARAQGPGAAVDSGLKREQDALFTKILANPRDLDVAFRHAEISTQLGDYEAAIGSLERMLFFNPNLPRVMLELGVLYFRLGSYEMSRTYFEKSVSAPDTPPDVRAKVDAYLAEIAKRLNPNQTTGFLQTGVRYQTNANAGPNGALVKVFGLDAILDNEFVQRPDWNWFAQGVVRNVIDFGNQRGDTWETTLGGYASRHDEFDRLNTALVDIQTGPRFALFPETLRGWSVRPYAGFLGINLAGDQYLSTQTAGASLGWLPEPGWAFEAGYERVRRNFKNTEEYPTGELQSGFQDTGYFTASGPLFFGLRWAVRGAVSDVDARVDWQSFLQRSLDVSLAYSFPVAAFGSDRLVTIIPFAGIQDSDYRNPDPFIAPDTTRHDRERKAGVALDIELTRSVGFGVRVQHSKTDSSLPNYELDNTSVYGGPILRF